jgi:hypothetical protein
VFLALQEVGQDLLTLGVADLLQDDLLGSLSTDAAKVDRLQRLFQGIAGLDFGIVLWASESGTSRYSLTYSLSGTTCQRRKDSKLPVLRSIETRTSASSWIRFLVADASASSRAPKDDFLADVLFAGQMHRPAAKFHGSWAKTS